MTNVEIALQKASKALDNGAFSYKNKEFIRELLTYDKKRLRKLTSNQYELLRKLAAEADVETENEDERNKTDSQVAHGGAREGAGRHSAEELGVEKRTQVPLSILPSIINDFKTKYGRGWSRRVEELIKADLDNQK